MLTGPLNDKECLQRLQDGVKRLIALPTVRARADEYGSIIDVTEDIRRRPQRDDLGDPRDGPRLGCAVSQRARHDAWDPNCFERTIDYLTYAEILDPRTERTCATVIVDGKWHTFPVEIRNGLPRIVVLDPYDTPPRNAMTSTAYEARNVAIGARDVLAPWYLEVAHNACIDDGGLASFDLALEGLRCALMTGEPLPRPYRDELRYVHDLTARDALMLWGRRGRTAADRVARSVRNFSLGLANGRVARVLRELARTGEQIAPHALRMALLTQFGPAAAIALDGVTVAMEPAQPGQPAQPAQPGQPAQLGQPAQPVLSVEPDDQDDGADRAEPAHPRPQTALDAVRRMTFAFRTT